MVCVQVAVSEGLVEREVWKRETGQGRIVVVARVDADGAMRDVDTVATEATEQGQERGRRVAEDAGLAAILFIKLHVARPKKLVRVCIARVLTMIQPGVDVKRVVVLVVERHLAKEFQVLGGHALLDSSADVFKVFLRLDT